MLTVENTTFHSNGEEAEDALAGIKELPTFIFGYIRVIRDHYYVIGIFECEDGAMGHGQREVINHSGKPGWKWYHWDSDNEDIEIYRARRSQAVAALHLSPGEREVLKQCLKATWDGNVVSKSCRDMLCDKGLINRYNGFQLATQQGLAVLDTLGELDHNQ